MWADFGQEMRAMIAVMGPFERNRQVLGLMANVYRVGADPDHDNPVGWCVLGSDHPCGVQT